MTLTGILLILMLLELLSSGPETVVLNADAVYVTTYSVLHLTMTLHRSAYFTNTEKSLPLSEVLFGSLNGEFKWWEWVSDLSRGLCRALKFAKVECVLYSLPFRHNPSFPVLPKWPPQIQPRVQRGPQQSPGLQCISVALEPRKRIWQWQFLVTFVYRRSEISSVVIMNNHGSYAGKNHNFSAHECMRFQP